MKKYFFFVFFFVFFFSCKEKQANSANENTQMEVKEKPFTVEIHMKVSEDDVTCLYFKDNTISFFNEEMAIYKNLVKSDSLQSIVFELPNDFIPNDFRFDLSHQNKNNTVFVEKIHFTFKGKDFQIENKDIDKYLKPNVEVLFNQETRVFSFKATEEGAYDPFLTTTGQFYPLLERLVGYEAFVDKSQ